MVTDLGDFVPWNPRVPPKLRALHDAGYKVVIFSNQGGVKGAMEGKRADVVRARLDACLLDDAELAAGPAAWAGYDDPFAPWLAEDEEEPSEGGLATGAAP